MYKSVECGGEVEQVNTYICTNQLNVEVKLNKLIRIYVQIS